MTETKCSTCKLPFVADCEESWIQRDSGRWERRYVQRRLRCPDCVGEGGRKPDAAMDTSEYLRKGYGLRLLDGFAMIGDDELALT